ncbi:MULTISPECIES: heme-copper oxidase subunit III [Haloferax]|uniref:Heme-copper oxidase subunit III n=1 Tax=Haloferax marinum TaxID=2666143 RepID=A0A6A8G3Z3_9EURY|nr:MULTISPECIES: heme-copper oxidase subunit III [Haloferax]KAB1196635.1 heme-copper oxidase subunit III [Haloferax sp. CBA1150]MRW95639.1 heme-copper oxidase subunit III [Haloferax marinum]
MSTEEAHDDHGHHLPAVQDWPRGFGEASWWPFVTAVGGAGIYVGAGLYIMGQDQIVGDMLGPAVFVGSIFVFLAGLYGWLYHAFVSHFWSRDANQKSASKLRWGMIAFLGSELATFGALFTYYFYIRAGAWPPQELPPLVGSLVLVNTAILIASSFTLHWAHVAIRNENRRNFILGLALTLLLGVIFIGGQVYEYYEFIVHKGFDLTTGVFGSAFYGLTGLHGLHVSMGAVLLGIVFVRALRGQYSAERHVSVSTASMYWHFVDVVWIFLVVVLYVGAEVGA